jgi:outer membrane protein OmpA-like peptidoglycan-associated protein
MKDVMKKIDWKPVWVVWGLLLLAGMSKAQEVQWASKVLQVSSEYSNDMYSSKQVLGPPNALPQGGDNPFAWSPRRQTGMQSITVGFDKPIQVAQIIIGECYNPGAVWKVYAIDPAGTQYLINEYTPKPIREDSRLLRITMDKTVYKVASVKVEMNCDKVPGFNSIDAIGISDSPNPIKIDVNVAKSINPNINTERLTEKINSPYDEINPVISPDGKRLYFGRKFHPENLGGKADPEDIWYSDWDDKRGEWAQAKNAGSVLNNKNANFLCAMTPDGNSMLMILGNVNNTKGKIAQLDNGVSIATKTSEGFTKPQPLTIEGYQNESSKASFYLSNSRKVLLLAIETPEGLGGLDLFVSFRKDDGTYSSPVNMGKNINTPSDELAPFLAADEKTLFFSSNGRSGYGMEDIYMTKRLDDSWLKWSTPENLGPGINSPQSDIFFNLPPNGDYAYYSSSGKEAKGQLDIFRLRIPDMFKPTPVLVISGKVLDKTTGKPVPAKILYENLSKNKELGSIEADPKTGEYKIVVPVGSNYGYLAASEGYISVHQSIDASRIDEGQDIKQDLYLIPVAKDKQIALNNIFFDPNKAAIKQESIPELKRLVKLLKEKPSMMIEIGGHTDTKASNDYSMTLSQNRAKAVVDFLIKNGINPNRLKIKAQGKSQPVIANTDRPDGSALNRRVDIRIISY